MSTVIMVPAEPANRHSQRYEDADGVELTLTVHTTDKANAARIMSGIARTHALKPIDTPSSPFLAGMGAGLAIVFFMAVIGMVGGVLADIGGVLEHHQVMGLFEMMARVALFGTVPFILFFGLITKAFIK